MHPSTLKITSKEYKRLNAIASILEALSPNKATYFVSECYYNTEERQLWTNIVRRNFKEGQLLDVERREKAMNADTLEKIIEIVNEIREDELFGDI